MWQPYESSRLQKNTGVTLWMGRRRLRGEGGGTKGGRGNTGKSKRIEGGREEKREEVMFPLLSPLPVLIPKWRDSERHRSGCFDRLPLFTPQHKLTHTHTQITENPTSLLRCRTKEMRGKSREQKNMSQWSLKHKEAFVYRSWEAQDISSSHCISTFVSDV